MATKRIRDFEDEPLYYRERPFWQDLLVTVLPVLCDQVVGLVRDAVAHKHELKMAAVEAVRVEKEQEREREIALEMEDADSED